MGTLSKRPLSDFGVDIKDRIQDFRSHVGSRIDRLHDEIDVSSRRGVSARDTTAVSSPRWWWIAGGVLVGATVTALALRFSGRLTKFFARHVAH